jgi:hypothetical protein
MSPEYNAAYHLRCQIVLRSGRRLTLQSLDQRMTYAGWLEGVPSREWNDRIIEAPLKEAGDGTEDEARPALIAPARRDYLRKPGDMTGHRAMGGQVPEWLPMVTCVAVLRATAPARDPSKDGSTLTVVWFQDEYALPIDESVLQQLQSIDWEQSAADFEF